MKYVGVIRIITLTKEPSSFFHETQKEMLVIQNDCFSYLLSCYATKKQRKWMVTDVRIFCVSHTKKSDGFITAFNNISNNDHFNLNIIPEIKQTNK